MTTEILQPLTAPLATLPSLSGKNGEALAKSVGDRVIDLLFAPPTRLIANKLAASIREAELDEYQGIAVDIEGIQPPKYGGRQPWLVQVRDETAKLALVFFKNPGNYLAKRLPSGQRRLVFGKMEEFRGRLQIVHPSQILPLEEAGNLPKFKASYPHVGGLYPATRKKALDCGLGLLKKLDEWQPKPNMAWDEAIRRLHYPRSTDDFAAARRRLAFDELLAEQLVLAMTDGLPKTGMAAVGNGKLTGEVIKRLDFTLTEDQRLALDEIAADLAAPKLMNRLLQGDVGSGKTIVAILAMLQAVEAGFQAVMMAPTDFLVSQHLKTIAELTKGLGVQSLSLSGATTAKTKKQALEHIAKGNARIVIGTHALFQDKVEFADLALVVIDEQQRFGVAQRLALGEKGGGRTNILSLSATPIPRTLALTKHFSMSSSALRRKPQNREPTTTRILPLSRLGEVVDKLRSALERGEQAFWVCPSIQAEEESALENRFEAMIKAMPKGLVGKAHGAMAAEERRLALRDFRDRRTRLLVATTVVEVGIDVPGADIMVVENAERFGLAQLHQLRGRIGRSGGRGKMVGVYDPRQLSQVAESRLKFFKACDDGFQLAEKDLQLRSSGEILGTRQSGLPKQRFADFALDADLLEAAHALAKRYLSEPLSARLRTALRQLLELFGYRRSLRYLKTG